MKPIDMKFWTNPENFRVKRGSMTDGDSTMKSACAYTWGEFLQDGGGDPDHHLGNASPVRIAATVRALDAAQKRIAELEQEMADTDDLVARQARLLTDAVNVLRGEPPELTLWSHHDVADLARKWVDRAHVAEAERDADLAAGEAAVGVAKGLREQRNEAAAEVERLKGIIRQAECLDVDLECAWCHADMSDPENTHERDCVAFTMVGEVRGAR